MKLSKILAVAVVSLMFTSAYAVETEQESQDAVKNDVKRDTNKTVNRIKEAVCMESDTECLKQKMEHRVEETKETVKDKATEIKKNVD
jgi:hypothetical protein